MGDQNEQTMQEEELELEDDDESSWKSEDHDFYTPYELDDVRDTEDEEGDDD